MGYVQVRRVGNRCIVKGRICPEHKVRNKPYFVTATIDEEAESVVEVKCISCVAALGGCKHAMAFLMWLHRRSEEPAPTEVICYWKKSALSQVGSEEKFIEATRIGKKLKKTVITTPDTTGFLEETVDFLKNTNYSCPIGSHYGILSEVKKLSVHQLMIEFINSNIDQSAESFVKFCVDNMNEENIKNAAKLSHQQSEDSLWFELRYGRITASKLYEMAVCKKSSGSLVNEIIGVAKKFDTVAMKRGKKLEAAVLIEIGKKLKINIQNCGFIIIKDYGVMGASPDGVTEDRVIEIKCPISNKSFKRYINESNEIGKKHLAQINLQMLARNVKKGYFCVAHPDFEETSECTILDVTYDPEFTQNVIECALNFWKNNVFPLLYSNCK